jgi:lipoprotein NlpI
MPPDAVGRLPRPRLVRLAPPALALVLALTAGTVPSAQQNGSATVSALLDKATNDFFAGRIAESVAGFDRAAALDPSAVRDLWQRGMALYYAGRYRDCRAQFEQRGATSGADVENAAWHFLCVARSESPARARAALLAVQPDDREPMREIYRMFAGTIAPESVLVAGVADQRARFYSILYVGLSLEALGEKRAELYIKEAASDRYERVGGYMSRVAKIHAQVRGWK